MLAFTGELLRFVIFLFLFDAFFTQRISFNICCKTGMVVLNSFNFCWSVNLLISPSNLNERAFPGGTVVKNLPANAGDMGLSPGPGRSHMPRSN